MSEKLKSYLFKVDSTCQGECYIGFFLVLAKSRKKALKILHKNPKFIDGTLFNNIPHYLTIEQTTPESLADCFIENCFELIYDCFN